MRKVALLCMLLFTLLSSGCFGAVAYRTPGPYYGPPVAYYGAPPVGVYVHGPVYGPRVYGPHYGHGYGPPMHHGYRGPRYGRRW